MIEINLSNDLFISNFRQPKKLYSSRGNSK